MSDLPPDPREETEKRIQALMERKAQLLREVAQAEEELRSLTGSEELRSEN